MAVVATLPHVDIAAGKFERRVGTYAIHLLDRALEIEQRRDFHDAANRDQDQHAEHEQERVSFEDGVFLPERHASLLTRPAPAARGTPALWLRADRRFATGSRP